MKKLLIMMLLASMVLMVSGCGKDKDADATSDAVQQEQQQQGEAEQAEQPEQKKEDIVTKEVEKAKEITSVDINNMNPEDMDKLVNMFNSDDSTEEQKEAARIQLEALFKQAEQSQE